MNTGTRISTLWLNQRRTALCLAILLLIFNVSCVPVNAQPPVQPSPNAVEPMPTPTTPSPTVTSEPLVPAGWMTHTSQHCEYALSYPADMQSSDNGPSSRTFSFKLDNPEEGARNFVYVSVILLEHQNLGEEGIYNYEPTEADTLLNLQVGESKSSRDVSQVAPWFTYQRLPDTIISGYDAKTYENLQPWEFPEGTKEIRYYLSLNGCTYVIGGYLDTAGSNQSGAITEELFHQIVATAQLMP